MKTLPIPMHARSSAALRAGAKTQTRRAVREAGPVGAIQRLTDGGYEWSHDGGFDHGVVTLRPPYGWAGTLLWVREPWRAPREFDHLPPRDLFAECVVGYEANDACAFDPRVAWGKYRHARFMPRCFSRTTLFVRDVRIERVQDATAEDILAEGVSMPTVSRSPDDVPELWEAWAELWDDTNGDGAFDANPWVWVYDFLVIPEHVDAVLADPQRFLEVA